MLPDVTATVLLSPFLLRQTARFITVCHSACCHAKDRRPLRLTLEQVCTHYDTSEEILDSQKREEEQ